MATNEHEPNTTNGLIKVEPSFDSAPKLTLNPKFKDILNQMNLITQDYHKLIDNVNLDELSEDQIDHLTKQLAPMQSYYKQIESAKKNMRKLFNAQRDDMTAQLDAILQQNGMDQLNEMDATKKQLRRDLLNHRANRRWDELKSTFDTNFELYPDIGEYAPQLLDWGNFRIMHPKLVSGAKSADITDKQRSIINNTIADWNNDLQLIINNDAKLPNEYQGKLLSQWVQNPTHTNLVRLTDYYQQVADEQTKRLKTAQEKQDAQAVNRAKLAIATVDEQPEEHVNEFNWLLDYALANKNTHNITKDDAKASLIVILSQGMMDSNSIFYQHIGRDYHKMIRAIKYILSR